MKKMKKILAMLLALTMVLGMGLTSMAAEPKADDHKEVTVSNVEEGAVLNAYQLIDAKYGKNDAGEDNKEGFLKYVWAFDYKSDGVEIKKDSEVEFDDDGNIPLLTSDLITKLAANTEGKTPITFTATGTTAKMDLTVGTWMILVTPSSEKDIKVYNPMIASVYYEVTGSGDNAEVVAPGVGDKPVLDAEGKWKLVTTDAYVKSSDVTLTKEAETTWNLGDLVAYTVTATVPDYSDAYDVSRIKYEIVDTAVAGELEIQNAGENLIIVTADSKEAPVYTLTATSDTYTVTFDGSWVAENPNATITITYKAKIVGEIYANDATAKDAKGHDNTVTLTYTNNLSYGNDTLTANESVYTFKVENLITKTGADNDKDGNADPLAGALFGIYKDAACTNPYVNMIHEEHATYKTGTVESKLSADGKNAYVNIYGLDLGTYYIKEIEAPTGYSLNDTVYKIVVSAKENDNANASDTVENIAITINDGKTDSASVAIPNTKINALPSTGGIGTTIFTVAGCGIMIAAAYFFFASRKKENN